MNNRSSNICPLCNSKSKVFIQNKKRLYHQCTQCQSIFVDKGLRPDLDAEKSRYEEHINDIEDLGYQQFVSPITSAILRDYRPSDKGLDFGAGTGPVISKILNDNKYSIVQYDPFFHNYPKLLEEKYDYIACCEVIEHFHHPKKEFLLLKNLLAQGGRLYIMTSIYDDSIDFKTWNYKDDRTHVFIYQKETLQWIKEELGFSAMTIEGRLIIFF
jgi:2-polyprenyl-3-methyl-5-hydroxy-6-metoxy-1,4-benzoquinol methylase